MVTPEIRNAFEAEHGKRPLRGLLSLSTEAERIRAARLLGRVVALVGPFEAKAMLAGLLPESLPQPPKKRGRPKGLAGTSLAIQAFKWAAQNDVDLSGLPFATALASLNVERPVGAVAAEAGPWKAELVKMQRAIKAAEEAGEQTVSTGWAGPGAYVMRTSAWKFPGLLTGPTPSPFSPEVTAELLGNRNSPPESGK